MLAFQVLLFYSLLFHVHAGYISNLILFDTTVNPGKNLGPLESGRVVNLATTGTSLSVVANVDSKTPGSVQFIFDNSFTKTESNPIYALNGNAGTQLYPFQPLTTIGAHTITTKFYNSTSNALTETNTISFTIIQGPFAGFNLVNTNTNQEIPLTSVVKLADVGTALSILAKETIENTIEYVSFWFDGAFVRAEQGAPWALASNNSTRSYPYDPLSKPGIHTITAEAFGFNNEKLGEMTYTFTVQGISPMSVPVSVPITSPNVNLAPATKKPAVAPVAIRSPVTSPTVPSRVVPVAKGVAPLLEDNVSIRNDVPGRSDVKALSWADSYSDGDSCYCATSFDHDIGSILVDTPLGVMTILEVCDLLGDGPTGSKQGRPLYNDIQCGNGPANDAGDEDDCPGRTEHGQEGCKYIGPKWNFAPFL
jgi:hypothetical protein